MAMDTIRAAMTRNAKTPRALLAASTLAAAFTTMGLLAACSSSAMDEGAISATSLAEACSNAAYQPGTAYTEGARVTANGKAYACKPYPYTGWCSIGGAYAPGTGSNWQDAWTEVGACSSSGGGGGGGTTTAPSGGGGSCNATAWTAGKAYVTGDVVTYNGGYYVAEHDNPGYDPIISTWFWDPKSGCSGGGGGGGGTTTTPPAQSCNAAAWQAGHNYVTGDVVAYSGGYYVAEHDNPGYDPIISTWFWDPTTCGGGGNSGGGGNTNGGTTTPPPSGSTAIEQIISRSAFESMFPNRNPFYTYDGLVQATKTYPAFASSGSTDDKRREVAAFLANVNHETGALVYVEEIAKADYCDNGSPGCPCAPGKRYFGRGPLQLSWNYNYCSASRSIFGDQEVLRTDPDRVAREAWVAWATGLYFWMTSTGAGTMTAHDAMVNGGNFGQTIQTINGSLECGGRNPGSVQARVDAYVRFSGLLGVSPGTKTGC